MAGRETGKRKVTSDYVFRDGSCYYYSNVDRLKVVVSFKIIVVTVGFPFHIYPLAHYQAIIIVCPMNLYTCRHGQPLLLLCIKVQSLQEGGKSLLAKYSPHSYNTLDVLRKVNVVMYVAMSS